MKRVLIVIDMQEDFVRGSLGSKDAEAIVSKVKAKITEYMERGERPEIWQCSYKGAKMTIRHAVRKIKELEKLYESDFS